MYMIASNGLSMIGRAFVLLTLQSKGVSTVCYYENVLLPHLEGSTEELIVIDTKKEESWMSFK
jgi:hypothetical protein